MIDSQLIRNNSSLINTSLRTVFVAGCCIFVLTCFNAPSPSYLRPGHPAWPIGWVSGIAPDSIAQELPGLRAQNIRCIQCPLTVPLQVRKNLLSLCESEQIKLFLSLEAHDVQESQGTGMDGLIRDRLQSWSEAFGNRFPVECIPAVRCPAGLSDSLVSRVRQGADSVVQGLLILYAASCDSAGFSLLVNFDNPADREEDLRIAVAVSAENNFQTDSLIETFSALNADAVLWENRHRFPPGFISRIQAAVQSGRSF